MPEPDVRRRGRPRSERARKAVLEAALTLAGEVGPAGLSMEAIATRAGVSKDTLYRWWRSKTEVILDALAERGQVTIPLPDTGRLASDVQGFLRSTAASADQTTVSLLRAVAAGAAGDHAVAHLVRDRFISTRRAALQQVLDRAATRGEIPHDRVTVLLDLIYGSLWYRVIFDVAPIDDKWADQIAALLS